MMMAELKKSDMADSGRMMRGKVKTVIDRTTSLSELPAANRVSGRRPRPGKVVITVLRKN